LEEINGDLLAEDFYGVIATKVLRFFAFGTGRILELVERDFRSAPPPSFGSLPKAVGLTGRRRGLYTLLLSLLDAHAHSSQTRLHLTGAPQNAGRSLR